MQPDVTVVDVPDAQRFEARGPDGGLLGFAAYVRDGDAVVFTHTEVDEVVEGQGVGSRLAQVALDEVRAAGLAVVPLCPFIRAFIQRHPGYADLLRTPLPEPADVEPDGSRA
jgi:predicted GNAT family acetyltransferase